MILTSACVLLLLAGCSRSSIGPSQANRLPAWYGIVTQNWSPDYGPWTAELGVGWVRLDFNWFEIEPDRNVFDWAILDSKVYAAYAQSLRIYGTLAYTPAWAGPCPHCMPDSLDDWRQFVEAVLAHYRGAGIVFGIWNEPNLGFLNDTPDGARYAALFGQANAARLRVDRFATLAGPETSHHGYPAYYQSVMSQILPNMQAGDVVSVHYYPDAPFDLGTYMDSVNGSAGGRAVWLTETGLGTCDDAAQGLYFRSVLDTFYGRGRTWWPRVFFYVLFNGQYCTDAIVRPDGSRRPSFAAYQQFIAAHR